MAKQISGIYCWRHLASGRVYVGSSINVEARRQQHLYLLRNGRSHSPRLQAAWKAYGEAAFRFAVLEPCDRDSLARREAHWMGELDAVTNGFNCSADTTCATRGYTHSEQTREHMRQAQRGLRTAAMVTAAARNLTAYNLSLRGKAKSTEHRARISATNSGRRLSEAQVAKMRGRTASAATRAKMRGHRHSLESRDRMSAAQKARFAAGASHPRERPIVQLSVDGQQVAVWSHTKEASGATGIGRTSISNCLHGRSKSAGGFRWRHIDEEVPIAVAS